MASRYPFQVDVSVSGEPAQRGDVRAEARTVRVDDVVRPEGGHDRAAPAGVSQSGVRLERAEGTVGRRQELEYPTRSNTARGRNSSRRRRAHMLVVDRRPPSRVARGRRCPTPRPACAPARASTACPGTDGSDRRTHARRAGRRSCAWPAVERPDAERLEGDTLAVQHAQQVMVPRHQLGGRVAEPDVVGELCRVAVTVRAHDGQRPRPLDRGAARSAGCPAPRGGVGLRSARAAKLCRSRSAVPDFLLGEPDDAGAGRRSRRSATVVGIQSSSGRERANAVRAVRFARPAVRRRGGHMPVTVGHMPVSRSRPSILSMHAWGVPQRGRGSRGVGAAVSDVTAPAPDGPTQGGESPADLARLLADTAQERLSASKTEEEVLFPEDLLPGTREERTSLREGLRKGGHLDVRDPGSSSWPWTTSRAPGLSVLAPNIQSSFHVSSGVIVFVAGISSAFLVLGILPDGLAGRPLPPGPDHRLRHVLLRHHGVPLGAGHEHLPVLLGPLRGRGVPGVHADACTVRCLADTYPISMRGRIGAGDGRRHRHRHRPQPDPGRHHRHRGRGAQRMALGLLHPGRARSSRWRSSPSACGSRPGVSTRSSTCSARSSRTPQPVPPSLEAAFAPDPEDPHPQDVPDRLLGHGVRAVHRASARRTSS